MLNNEKRRCPNNYHKTPSGCVKNKTDRKSVRKSVRKRPPPNIDMDLFEEHVRQPPDMELYDAYYPKRSTRKVPKIKRSATPSPFYGERF
jgi:hypothetical protein